VVVAKVRRQEREGNTGCKRWEQLIQKLNTDDWPRHRPTVHQKQSSVRASSFPPHRWESKRSGVLSEERDGYGTARRRTVCGTSCLTEMVTESDAEWCTKPGPACELGAVSVRESE